MLSAISERNLEVRERVEGIIDLKASPCRERSDLLRSGATLTQLGIVLGLQGKHKEATEYLTCAKHILGEGREYYEIVAKLAAAQNQLNLEHYPQAVTDIDRVLNFEYLLTPQKLDALLVKLESLLNQKGKEVAARKTVDRIAQLLGYGDFFNHENLAKNIGDYPVQQVATFRLLIELSEQSGQRQWLKSFSEKGFQIIRQYQHQVTNPQAWNTARYDLIKSYLSASFDLSKPLNKQETASVFDLLERYYSIDPSTERNTFQANYGDSGDPVELSALYQAWLEAEHALVTANESSDELRARVDMTRDAYLSFRSDFSQPQVEQTEIVPLEEIQRRMSNEEILVRYFIDTNNSFVLLISKDKAQIHPLPNEDKIAMLSEQLNTDINNDNSTRVRNNYELSKLLPVDGLVSAKHDKLIIIPDNVLHRLPFSVFNLILANNDSISHQNHFQVVRTHSASQYYDERYVQPQVYAKNMAVFANPLLSLEDKINANVSNLNRNFLADLGALPGSMLEARYIRQLFPEKDIILGTGAKANKSFLTRELTRASRILHIATHGYYQQNSPDIVGLITSRTDEQGQVSPGFLSINELLSKPINSQLVVISGCDTMMGKYYKSSGMRSITRGFLAQGAQSVIGTLWPVQDKATAEFMKTFYQALRSNDGNSAKALQQTKQHFANRGRYRSPKYWAGFVLTANNRKAESIQIDNSLYTNAASIAY